MNCTFENMCENVKEMLATLKSTDSKKEIYSTLMRINTHVITTEEGLKSFKENEGLTYVTQYLTKPNEKILNISLGILANCCVEEDCRNKIISEGGLRHLFTIMKSVNQDRIQYRCCKLIGNLTRNSKLCSTLISKDICGLLNPILGGNPSVGTQFVALRCVNHIWSGANTHEKKIMAQSDVFKHSIQYLDSGNKDVQKLVLRILFCISRSRFDKILKELITEEVLEQVVSVASENLPVILRIVYYLSEYKYFHYKLAKAGVLQSMFSQVSEVSVKNLDPNVETTMDLVLRSVYRLSCEPWCREQLCRIPNAFDTFLNIIENSAYVKFKKYSALILSSYIYNDDLLKMLAKHRLISALTSYLRIVVDTEGEMHESDCNKEDPVAIPGSPLSSGGISPISDSGMSNSYSTSPTSEYFPTSPSLSGDSVYSPVCSPIQDDIEDFLEDDDNISVGDSCVAESPLIFPDDDTGKSYADEMIFNVLKRLAFKNEPYFDLCKQRTWETLLDYLILVRKSPSLIPTVLVSVAGNPAFFAELLKTQFALCVHKKLCRPVHTDCNCCQEMFRCGKEIVSKYTEVAESLYGTKILTYELEKKKNIDQVLLTFTIPLIVKSVSKLEQYLLHRFKLWDFILNNLNVDADYNSSLFEVKIASLHSLAKSVFLECPRIPITVCKKCDVASLTKEATISFLLDDGGTVTANKKSLCEKSEFFEAMFRCGFKEAKESVVRISNITSDCLTVLIRLIYSYCDCILPKNVLVMLELIIQSDRFLIPSLSEKLLNITMNHILDYKNGHLIYDWAVENGEFLPTNNCQVCQNVIQHALVDDFTFSQRVYMFRMLLSSKHKDLVMSHLNQIIRGQLTCKEVKLKSNMEYISREITAKRQKLS